MVAKFHIKDDHIHYKDSDLGASSLIHCDYNELVGVSERSGVVHHVMPERIDAVMGVGEKVIGIESKRPADLLNSFLVRRLKRQLRTLLALTDMPVLLIRGEITDMVTYDGKGRAINWDRKKLQPLFEELARWQMLGAVVLHGPEDARDVPDFLFGMTKILSGGRNVLVAVSGTDQNQERESRRGWLLRRIPGIGNKTSSKLHSAAGSTLNVLSASPQELDEWGANKRVVKAIKEAIK